MEPCSFEGENCVLHGPENDPSIQSINAFKGISQDGRHFITVCFKITKEELEEVIKTGRVWLTCLGQAIPPVMVSIEKPFELRPNILAMGEMQRYNKGPAL